MDKISEIAAHIKQAKNGVSFITGAGASRSANIPTAKQLVEQIHKDYNHCLNGLSDAERQHYGKVMAQLTPADRAELIVPLLEKSGINWGHIALAALIKKGHISRVLTFNFDLVLEKAVALLGMQLPIYDFGGAPSSEINRIAHPSILHLHGQSHGLVLLNTEEETKKHKKALQPILKDTICNHVTIVIGYSGETDGALEIISEEFNSHNRLIWLGYSDTAPPRLRRLLNKDYANYVGSCDFDLTMIKIAQNLDIWPPAIIGNPIQHLLEELNDVQDYPADKDAEINVLESTRERLISFSQNWQNKKDPDNEAFSELINRQSYAEGSHTINFENDKLSENAKSALSWVYILEGNDLALEAKKLESSEATKKFSESYRKYKQALEIQPNNHKAFTNWGNALYHQAKTLSPPLSSEIFSKCYKKYEKALSIEKNDYKALLNWGTALINEAKILTNEDAKHKYDEAYKKFQQRKLSVDKGIYNLACLYSLTKSPNKALEELIKCKNDRTLPNLNLLETDSDLDNLRETKEFKELIASLK